MSVTASAPGKLMLLGEHAVVYGYPCLVTAVDLRVSVFAEKSNQPIISIKTPKLTDDSAYVLKLADLHSIKNYERHTAFVVAAVQKIFSEFNINQGLNISTYGSQISYGLGSSSAVTVATVFALSQLFDLHLDKSTIFKLAYSAVLDVQKVGSGYDVASAVYGGTLYYQSNQIIDPLPIPQWPIVIGYSGQKVSTTYLVKRVKQLRDKHEKVIDVVFKTIGDIANMARDISLKEDWKAFGELMNISQGLLSSLGVSTSKLENLIYVARANGAYGAKLSGAGGGDCMYALVDGIEAERVKTAISSHEATVVPYQTNARGVHLD